MDLRTIDPPSLESTDLVVYRPESGWFSSSNPIVRINGQEIGRLKPGAVRWRRFEAGPQTVTLMAEVFGFPAWTQAEVRLPGDGGQTYYVRYMSTVASIAPGGIPVYNERLSEVPEDVAKSEIEEIFAH